MLNKYALEKRSPASHHSAMQLMSTLFAAQCVVLYQQFSRHAPVLCRPRGANLWYDFRHCTHYIIRDF